MFALAFQWPSINLGHYAPLQVGLAAILGVLAAMALVNAKHRVELTLAAAAAVVSLAALS